MQSDASLLHSLLTGEISVQGQFALGSNYTFLVDVNSENGSIAAVYKPSEGERPLWDFPDNTLAFREVAAFKVSEALEWNLVPPTVYRQDGPAGGGSLQLFLDAKQQRGYFTFSEAEKQMLKPAVVFDLLINNADRKAGHVILLPDGSVRLIDHGICFHADHKLRTVIWDFAGEPIPGDLLADLEALTSNLEEGASLYEELGNLLDAGEIQALRDRNAKLLEHPFFPDPQDQGDYPWPLI